MIPIKVRLFIRNIWNGMLGISVEIFVVAAFIFAGFAVSVLWWGLFR